MSRADKLVEIALEINERRLAEIHRILPEEFTVRFVDEVRAAVTRCTDEIQGIVKRFEDEGREQIRKRVVPLRPPG
jgi:transcriptional regulator of heat shock response